MAVAALYTLACVTVLGTLLSDVINVMVSDHPTLFIPSKLHFMNNNISVCSSELCYALLRVWLCSAVHCVYICACTKCISVHCCILFGIIQFVMGYLSSLISIISFLILLCKRIDKVEKGERKGGRG